MLLLLAPLVVKLPGANSTWSESKSIALMPDSPAIVADDKILTHS